MTADSSIEKGGRLEAKFSKSFQQAQVMFAQLKAEARQSALKLQS
jgi:hypothetical protein